MITPSEAAKLLASLRRPKVGVCPECGQQFEGRGRRKYCSYECMHRAGARAYYRRHRDRILARRRQKQTTSGAGGASDSPP